jgi:hypothetical protein
MNFVHSAYIDNGCITTTPTLARSILIETGFFLLSKTGNSFVTQII